MRIIFRKNLLFALMAVIVSLSACSDKNSMPAPSSPGSGSTTPSNLTLTADPKFGNILTDANGRSLYFFANDPNVSSNCNSADGCIIQWPAYYAGNETPPTGIPQDQIGTITRADGQKQSTFKKWPLYYYAGDKVKGDVNGDNFAGIWFVAKPDYSIMLANQQLVGSDGKNYIDALVEGNGNTIYLTDAAGVTLYGYKPDTFNTNTYTAPDFSNDKFWPIYQSDVMNVPSIFTKDLFTTITFNGKKQLTFRGHPLYFYIGDTARGQTNGINQSQPAPWPVLTPKTPALTP